MSIQGSFAFKSWLGAVAAASLVACGGGGDENGTAAGQGTLRLAIIDAPACGFDAVNITVDKVRVHQSSGAAANDSGWSELTLSPPRRLNLLNLTNGVMEELGQLPLPPGKYQQVRLVLADNGGNAPLANSVVPVGKAEVALKTPSGQRSGIKMNADIDVAANQMADFVIDFDTCKSVVTAGSSGQYLLKPVVTVIPRLISGVSGQVDATLYNADALISLQQNGQVVRTTAPDTSGRFVLQPAPAGSYTLVLSAPNRTTVVVNGVPVVANTVTTLGSTIAMPASPVATVHGTAPVDTLMRATQTLTSGPTIEVAGRYVDGDTGAYAFSLPTLPPQVANFATPPLAMTFVPDTAVAGRYSLRASLEGYADKIATLPLLTAGSDMAFNVTFP